MLPATSTRKPKLSFRFIETSRLKKQVDAGSIFARRTRRDQWRLDSFRGPHSGYIGGTAELVDQLQSDGVSPSRLYYASGSRGTQAGLTLGAKLCRADYRVYGVAVSAGEPEKIERARRIANEAAALLQLPERLDLSDLITDQNFIGAGYGIPTIEGMEAISLLARAEAIVLDPCYTSKAMAALIRHARTGEIGPDETVVFLHTGGAPAIFTEGFVAAFERTSPPRV